MKELSIEEKAKRYDDVINKLRYLIEQGIYPLITMANVQDYFPELKESEDERIRKDIIVLLNFGLTDGSSVAPGCRTTKEQAIAWLKKQYEKPQDKYALEDINEEKVEPKFKVGDWVVFNNNHESIYQIEKIKNFQYILRHILGGSMPLSFSSENMLRLWTLQDAKDRDVLSFYSEYKGNKMMQVGIVKEYVGKHGGCSNTFSVYVGMNWENNLQIGRYMGCDDIQPATKKQCDLMFQKMKEAGYTWDANKKELIKKEVK